MKTAPTANKEDVAAEALRSLPSDEAREAVASRFLPSQPVADEIWLMVVGAFRWVLWGATAALVVAVGVSFFLSVEQANIQILLTVFTTVAGIFAGFITGQVASRSTGGSSTGGSSTGR